MTRTVLLLLVTATLASLPSALAQDVGLDSATVVVTRLDPGVLYVDGERRAADESTAVRVAVGEHTFSLVGDPTAWNPLRTDVTLEVRETGAEVVLALPSRTRVETLPLGARLTLVHADGERVDLGPAPVDVDLPAGEVARVVAALPDHLAADAELPSAASVTLILPSVGEPDADPVTLLPMRGSTRTRTLVDVGIGAATLAAGAVAVFYKGRADRLDDELTAGVSQRSGSEALRDEILRNDRYSMVALAGMQVGVGVLAVRFVLR